LQRNNMPLLINLQLAVSGKQIPGKKQFQSWADAAGDICTGENRELTIRVAGEQEVAELNSRYRHKTGPTNVLSFPFEDPPGLVTGVLGDLVLCAPVILREAEEQDKTAEAHWAHMLIHGVLHLCGYDHIEPDQADEMEALETTILARLGYPPPYEGSALQSL